MLQIIYTCTAVDPFSTEQLIALLRGARSRNEAAGISGMLLYHEGSFLQVMEGPDDKVESLFGKIQADPRITHILLLWRDTIQQKEFEHWSMGFVDTAHIAEHFEGFVDYTGQLKSKTICSTKARILLKRFQQGEWHGFACGSEPVLRNSSSGY